MDARMQQLLDRASLRVTPLGDEAPPKPTANPFAELLAAKGFIVLDGALATELETRGYDLTDPLWSCRTLLEQPKAIEQVHLDYYQAGADVAITASYQATVKGLQKRKGMSEKAALDVIKRSVTLARNAQRSAQVFDRRDKVFNTMYSAPDHVHQYDAAQQRLLSQAVKGAAHRPLLVAGSVGPYGAYLADGSEYRGDYGISPTELADFHRPRIQALVEMGVDILACETMPSIAEVQALSQLLTQEFPDVYCWFSFSLKDAVHLSDGSALKDACEALSSNPKVAAIGVNCVRPDLVGTALRHMRTFTALPLIAYPNSGETWNADSRSWQAAAGGFQTWAEQVLEWKAAGATIIGGCCRTTPDLIEMVAKLIA